MMYAVMYGVWRMLRCVCCIVGPMLSADVR